MSSLVGVPGSTDVSVANVRVSGWTFWWKYESGIFPTGLAAGICGGAPSPDKGVWRTARQHRGAAHKNITQIQRDTPSTLSSGTLMYFVKSPSIFLRAVVRPNQTHTLCIQKIYYAERIDRLLCGRFSLHRKGSFTGGFEAFVGFCITCIFFRLLRNALCRSLG